MGMFSEILVRWLVDFSQTTVYLLGLGVQPFLAWKDT